MLLIYLITIAEPIKKLSRLEGGEKKVMMWLRGDYVSSLGYESGLYSLSLIKLYIGPTHTHTHPHLLPPQSADDVSLLSPWRLKSEALLLTSCQSILLLEQFLHQCTPDQMARNVVASEHRYLLLKVNKS